MLRVAAVQMQSSENISANVALARDLLDQAIERGVDLVAFPENFLINSDQPRHWLKEAQEKKGVLIETLQEWAAENGVWILAGGIAMKKKPAAGKKVGKITNSSLLIDSDGEILARYDKMHLFDVKLRGQKPFQESSLVEAGKKPVVAETPWGRMGLSVCYDLRFPELYRAYSDVGCRVIFAPSHFNEATGRAHWDALTKARAIENQAYLIAPAQWGTTVGERKTYGHTRILNPWGRLLAERPQGNGIAWADLDFEDQDRIRAELPALKHRRL